MNYKHEDPKRTCINIPEAVEEVMTPLTFSPLRHKVDHEDFDYPPAGWTSRQPLGAESFVAIKR